MYCTAQNVDTDDEVATNGDMVMDSAVDEEVSFAVVSLCKCWCTR